MKVDKYDMALANAARDAESSPVLTQICFREGKLSAINGPMLVCRKADVEPDDGFTGEQVLIPAKMMKQIKPTAKKPTKLTVKDKEITATYLERGQPIDPKLQFKADMNAEFPNYQQLFPKGKKHHQCALDIGLLRQLLACLPGDGILGLGFGEKSTDKMEFIVIGGNCTDQAYDSERPIYGLLMPMFVQWDGTEWQRANEETEIEKTAEK